MSNIGETYRRYTAAMHSVKQTRDKQHQRRSGTKERLIAGGCGGLATALFMTPFDVVKIRLQAQRKPMGPGDRFLLRDGILDHVCTCSNGRHLPANAACEVNVRGVEWYRRPIPGHFTGTLDAFRGIVRAEGAGSLWSGLYPTILLSLPTVAIYYTLYDSLKDFFGYSARPDSSWIPVTSAVLARTVASTAFCPIEAVRVRLQAEKLLPLTAARAIWGHVRVGGVGSLFLGLQASLLRDVPFSVIYWAILESTRNSLCRRYERDVSSLPVNLAAGSLAGSIAAVCTLPFDVVKTHTQMTLGLGGPRPGAQQKSVSVFESLVSIWIKEGTPGLFSGIVPRLLRTAPACAIMLSSYELIKRLLAPPSSPQS